MTVTKVSCWKTTSGRYFESKEEAEVHESVSLFDAAIDQELHNVSATPTSITLEFSRDDPIVVTAVVHEGYPRLRVTRVNPLIGAR